MHVMRTHCTVHQAPIIGNQLYATPDHFFEIFLLNALTIPTAYSLPFDRIDFLLLQVYFQQQLIMTGSAKAFKKLYGIQTPVRKLKHALYFFSKTSVI